MTLPLHPDVYRVNMISLRLFNENALSMKNGYGITYIFTYQLLLYRSTVWGGKTWVTL